MRCEDSFVRKTQDVCLGCLTVGESLLTQVGRRIFNVDAVVVVVVVTLAANVVDVVVAALCILVVVYGGGSKVVDDDGI